MSKRRRSGYGYEKLRPVERELLRRLRDYPVDGKGRVPRGAGRLWTHVTADKYD